MQHPHRTHRPRRARVGRLGDLRDEGAGQGHAGGLAGQGRGPHRAVGPHTVPQATGHTGGRVVVQGVVVTRVVVVLTGPRARGHVPRAVRGEGAEAGNAVQARVVCLERLPTIDRDASTLWGDGQQGRTEGKGEGVR